MPVAPRIVNDVSYVMQINHDTSLAWQAQYLVRLEGDSCCSATRDNNVIPFASQAQYLVRLQGDACCFAH